MQFIRNVAFMLMVIAVFLTFTAIEGFCHETESVPLKELLNDEDLRAFLKELPKIDLHRHLEGDINPDVFLQIARQNKIKIPGETVEELKPLLQMIPGEETSLLNFIRKFGMIGKVFINREAIAKVTYESIRNCSDDNIKYVELRFSPYYMAGTHNLDRDRDVIQGVLDGMEKAGKDFDTKVRLIFIIERQMGVKKAEVVEKLLEKYRNRGAVALDLANDERNYPPAPYAPVYVKAQESGLWRTVHAGEDAGPENVKTAIISLRADRIGHGVFTYKDPKVEEMVKERRIPLEMAPTCNLLTGAVKNLGSHPIKRYMDRGIIVTVNTDDPAICNTDLTNEYFILTKQFGFTLNDLRTLIGNSINSAFLPDDEKDSLRKDFKKRIDSVVEKYINRR